MLYLDLMELVYNFLKHATKSFFDCFHEDVILDKRKNIGAFKFYNELFITKDFK